MPAVSPRRRPPPRRRGEPAIALVNIVFLLLMFFLVASRIAPPLPEGFALVSGEALEAAPPGVLAVRADGSLWRAGQATDIATVLATAEPDAPLRLMPDRALPAHHLLALARALQARGAEDIRLVGMRGAAAPVAGAGP